jgi:hypothetical protein
MDSAGIDGDLVEARDHGEPIVGGGAGGTLSELRALARG